MRSKLIAPLAMATWLGCAAFAGVAAPQTHASLSAPEWNPSTAINDARDAAKVHDFRVLAVWRYALFFPGLNIDQEEVEKRYGYKVIEGTSETGERRLRQSSIVALRATLRRTMLKS